MAAAAAAGQAPLGLTVRVVRPVMVEPLAMYGACPMAVAVQAGRFPVVPPIRWPVEAARVEGLDRVVNHRPLAAQTPAVAVAVPEGA